MRLNTQTCESVSKVDVTSCNGKCGDSFEESAVYWLGEESGTPLMQKSQCKCCKGLTGDWQTHDVRVFSNH